MAEKQTVLAIILKATDAASKVFTKIDKKVAKLGKSVASVGAKMSKAITAPFLAAVAGSVAAAGKFDRSMSNISTLVDTNVESMDAMGRAVLKMSTDSGEAAVPLEDMAGALYDIRSAGVDASDAMRVLSKAGKLSVAGLGTTAQAANIGTWAINAFGLRGEEAERAFNTFFTTVKMGKTNLSELSQGFGSVAGIVASNNIELDEFMAITAALTTTGLKASEAYTQQKAVLSGLTRVTKDTRKVFRRLGVKDFPELVKKSGGFQAAINKVSGAVKGNKGELLKLLGSTEALNAVLAITGEQGAAATAALAEMRSGADNLGEAFDKQNKTGAAAMQRLKNSVNVAAISLGKVLAPVAAKVAAIVTKMANAFAALDDDTKEVIVTIAAVAAVVGPLVLITGKLITATIAIKGAVLGAAAAFSALSGASAGAGDAMSDAAGKAGKLSKVGRFAKMAGGLAAAATVGWELGRALDNALGLSDKLAGVNRKPRTEYEGGKALGFSDEKLARLGIVSAESQAEKRRKASEVRTFGRELTPQELAERREKSMALSAARAASAAGAPGQPGQSGTVKVQFENVPRGTRVTQTAGDPIDLSVGRQLAAP